MPNISLKYRRGLEAKVALAAWMPMPHSISTACSSSGISISANSLASSGSQVGTGVASAIWSSRCSRSAPHHLAAVERDDRSA